MKIAALLLFILACCTHVRAQKKTPVTVKAGQNIMEVLPAEAIFYFPQFTNGSVYLRDGSAIAARMNYNSLVNEMHFINPRGDTLALDQEKTIRMVVVGKDSFYYDKGYLRLLWYGPEAMLLIKQVWGISDARQAAAVFSSTKSVFADYLVGNRQGGKLYDLTVNADVLLSQAEQYYLGDRNGRFFPAGRKSLLQLFPKAEKRIEGYLKENRVNFSDREDLVRLVQFVNQL